MRPHEEITDLIARIDPPTWERLIALLRREGLDGRLLPAGRTQQHKHKAHTGHVNMEWTRSEFTMWTHGAVLFKRDHLIALIEILEDAVAGMEGP